MDAQNWLDVGLDPWSNGPTLLLIMGSPKSVSAQTFERNLGLAKTMVMLALVVYALLSSMKTKSLDCQKKKDQHHVTSVQTNRVTGLCTRLLEYNITDDNCLLK